jgi:signal transduction histidine kinase
LFRALIPQNVILKTDLPFTGPIVRADPVRIQHVLTNLLTNAWEAAGDNGETISLTVKTTPAAAIATTHRAPIDWQSQDILYACLEIRDTGCGIADHEIEQIFDPFYSTKFPGRGMGLAVVLGITRMLDGVITVESNPGSGSVFRIYFPVAG